MGVALTKASSVRRDPRLRRMRTDQMKPGVVLRQAIFAEDGVLLLAGGVRVDSTVISRLIQRGVTAVWVSPSEMAHLTGKDREPAPKIETASNDRTPFVTVPAVQGTVPYSDALQGRVTTSRRVAVSEVATVFRTCDIVRSGDLGLFEDLTITSLAQLVEDPDLFVAPEALAQGTEYPAQQAVQSSSIALAIGARMGLQKRDLALLGTGCLVHDLGMMRMNAAVLRQADFDERSARLEFMKHPSTTFDLLDGVAQKAGQARLVAYQIHERMNGSGFPRGREGNQIHPLSRIAAVADTYARMVCPGGSTSGYDAVVHLLEGASRGLFDPDAVRGLLKAFSLFPIGSLVELNDGRFARVLRSNGDAYTRPVVEAWAAGGVNEPKQLLDLLMTPDVHILRVIPEPSARDAPVEVPGLVATLRGP